MKVTIIILGLIIISSCKPDTNLLLNVEEMKADSTETKQIIKEFPEIDIAYIMGKFEPSMHESFAEIPIEWADQSGRYLRKDALKAFVEMAEKASVDGVQLKIKSSTRNFNIQKGIWERKWNGETILEDGTNAAKDISDSKERAIKILEYSSMPGTSRHHWGTDVDVNAFNNQHFNEGEGLKVYNWLSENAGTFGFYQPYTAKGDARPHGYNEEKWHWSYFPVSDYCTELARKNLRPSLIGGFEGGEVATSIGVVDRYVLGVAKH